MKKITLIELAHAIKYGNKKAINEASLIRIWQHAINNASDSFAMITAFRNSNSKSKNISLNKQLGSDVRSLGLGFFKVKGYWMECSDPDLDYSKCPDNLKVPVIEDTLFIPNITKKQSVNLAGKYYQDAIIYQGKETNDKTELISKSGQTLNKLGKFSPGKIARAYSEIRGRSFTFEGFEYKPTGMLTRMAFESILKNLNDEFNKN